jgi:hypothetical protein
MYRSCRCARRSFGVILTPSPFRQEGVMAEASVGGRFLWYELLTKDPKASMDFYSKVVGWGTTKWEGMESPYHMFTQGEAPLAGLMELPEDAKKAGAPTRWLPYMGTDDVDATLTQAESLGAKVCVKAQDIPTVGRMAVLADPQGALFALFRPASSERSPEEAAQIGGCSWHELCTLDHPKAFEFYAALFGWERKGEAHDMGPLGTYQEYGRPGSFPLGGFYNKPTDMPAPPHWMLYFRVRDVAACAEVVKAHGGQILNGPTEVPGGDFIVNCVDSQGGAFSLHHKKA